MNDNLIFFVVGGGALLYMMKQQKSAPKENTTIQHPNKTKTPATKNQTLDNKPTEQITEIDNMKDYREEHPYATKGKTAETIMPTRPPEWIDNSKEMDDINPPKNKTNKFDHKLRDKPRQKRIKNKLL